MFSYLEAVKSLVIKEVFQRGQKLYLGGDVLTYTSLTLDYWRLYNVKGTTQDILYKVKIPLLHLALKRANWKKAPKALDESANCECAYYQEYGVCKHLVGVCAALDNEFYFRSTAKDEAEVENMASSILEQIIEVETQKEENEWLKNFEIVISNSNWYQKSRWLSTMTNQIRSTPELYVEFWNALKGQVSELCADFDHEKKCLALAVETLIFDGDIWWSFWREFIEKGNFQNTKYFWMKVFLWKSDSNINKIFPKLMYFARQKYSEKEKLEIISLILSKSKISFAAQLEYTSDLQILSWLKENMDKIDPQNLLKLVELFPDDTESIELKIYNQVREWVDLLPAGEGEELVQILQSWRDILGNSDLLQDLGNYIITTHKRRRNLVSQVKLVIDQ